MSNEVRIGVHADDKASGPLDHIRDSFEKFQKQGAQGFAIGAGAAVTAKAIEATGEAIGKVEDLLKDSAQAAIADEQSQSKLGASLKANVPAWDGNTRAIEASLEAGQKKGFTDAEQRDSLSLLVAATHDVNKALDVQSVAMDLARFKHIDLQTASEALTKVEAGRFRILASLGIHLKEGATATEALAAVEAVAAGQADAFGDTTEGAMRRSEVAIEEAKVSFGEVLLPAMKVGADFITNSFVPTLRDLGGELEQAAHGAEILASPLARAADAGGGAGKGFDLFGAVLGAIPFANTSAGLQAIEGDLKKQAAAAERAASAMTDLRDTDKLEAPTFDLSSGLSQGLRDQAAAEGTLDERRKTTANNAVDYQKRAWQGIAGVEQAGFQATRTQLARTTEAIATNTADAFDDARQRAATALTAIPPIVKHNFQDPFGLARKGILQDVDMTFAGIAARIATGRDQIARAISGATDAVFDPKIVRAQIATLKDQLSDPELTKNLHAKDAPTRHEAQLRQLELQKQLADLTAEYTKFGTDASRAAKLAAELVDKNLLAGLKSPDPVQRAAAQEATKGIVDELSKLKGASFLFGRNTGNAYADGLRAAAAEIANAARVAVGAAVPGLRAASPPGPESPLHNIGDWGYATGLHWAEMLAKGAAGAKGALHDAIGKAGGPFGGGPGMTGRPGSHAMVGHGGNTYNLNLDGRTLMRIVGQHEWIDDRLLHGAMRPGMAQ